LILHLIAKMNQGYDMVIASRSLGPARSADDDWLTAFGNWPFTRTVNLLHGGERKPRIWRWGASFHYQLWHDALLWR
jgi:hypothetical protein